MRILLTGGTGFIGSAVARDLLGAGHEVLALARSKSAEEKVQVLGCHPLAGELADAPAWLPTVAEIDAVVHTAATFGADMAAVEARFLDALIPWSAAWQRASGMPLPLVYTGGCWLYGAVGDMTAVEGAPFDPLPAFAFMVAHRARLFASATLSTRVVHPAMVWDADGGVLASFLDHATAGQAPVVTGALSTRWPMVHVGDVARLFRLALERGRGGSDYHAVGETAVSVGEVAAAIARRHGAPAPRVRSVDEAVTALGDWAAGLALDQTMDAPLTRAELGWRPEAPTVIEAVSHGR